MRSSVIFPANSAKAAQTASQIVRLLGGKQFSHKIRKFLFDVANGHWAPSLGFIGLKSKHLKQKKKLARNF
jgi:hypothetical protein